VNGVRTGCLLDYVNDAALACRVADSGRSFRRVVYPHAGIDRVWVTRLVPGPSGKALLIGAGIGALVGGLAARSGGAGGVGLGILFGGGLGSGFVAMSDPLGLRMHNQRVLIYVARRA